jgi:hypothetical protein
MEFGNRLGDKPLPGNRHSLNPPEDEDTEEEVPFKPLPINNSVSNKEMAEDNN